MAFRSRSHVRRRLNITPGAILSPGPRRRTGSTHSGSSRNGRDSPVLDYFPETHSTKAQLQTAFNASRRARQAFAKPPRIDACDCNSAMFSPGPLPSENVAVITVETHADVFSNFRSTFSRNRIAKARRHNFFRFGPVKSDSIFLVQASQYARLLNVRSVAQHLRKVRCPQNPVSRNGSGMILFVPSQRVQQVAAWRGKGKFHRLATESEKSRPGAGVCHSNSGVPGASVEKGKSALERAGGPAR